MEGNSFSYQVSLSKDQTLWMEVFDYSTFACWGAQDLPFPPQSARHVNAHNIHPSETYKVCRLVLIKQYK